jgi:hypothetical protein
MEQMIAVDAKMRPRPEDEILRTVASFEINTSSLRKMIRLKRSVDGGVLRWGSEDVSHRQASLMCRRSSNRQEATLKTVKLRKAAMVDDITELKADLNSCLDLSKTNGSF